VAIAFRLPPRDRFSAIEEAALQREGLRSLTGIGFSAQVGTMSFSDLWESGGIRPWLQAAESLICVSDNENDTGAGSGARTVLLEGLDLTGLPIQELVTLNGTTPTTPTTLAFFRLDVALVREVGSYGGANAGTIIIETATMILQAEIIPGMSRSAHVHRTIPANAEGLFYSMTCSVEANKSATVRLRVRTDANNVMLPFFPTQVVAIFPGLLGFSEVVARVPQSLPPFSDIWLDAQGDSPNTVVGVTFQILTTPT